MNKDFSASALRYRPQKFQEVVGQDAIVKTLLNAIKSDSLAQALLFCGPRGVGKTTCARILAKEINIQHGSDWLTYHWRSRHDNVQLLFHH